MAVSRQTLIVSSFKYCYILENTLQRNSKGVTGEIGCGEAPDWKKLNRPSITEQILGNQLISISEIRKQKIQIPHRK